MLNYQQLILFGHIQTSQTCGQPYSDTVVSVLWQLQRYITAQTFLEKTLPP